MQWSIFSPPIVRNRRVKSQIEEQCMVSCSLFLPLVLELSSFGHSTSKSTRLQSRLSYEMLCTHSTIEFRIKDTIHTCLQKRSGIAVNWEFSVTPQNPHRTNGAGGEVGHLERWSSPGRRPWTPPTASPSLFPYSAVENDMKKKKQQQHPDLLSQHSNALRGDKEWRN